MWDPDSDLAVLARRGIFNEVAGSDGVMLPEMHTWLGCPDSGEIIDFTTGLWPAHCLEVLGAPWRAALPPDYLWVLGGRLPEGVYYIPDRDAIEVACLALRGRGHRYP